MHHKLVKNRGVHGADMNIVQGGFRKSLKNSRNRRSQCVGQTRSMTGINMSVSHRRVSTQSAMNGLIFTKTKQLKKSHLFRVYFIRLSSSSNSGFRHSANSLVNATSQVHNNRLGINSEARPKMINLQAGQYIFYT